LKNIAEYYKKASIEEREHAHKLMEYQNMRGGTVKLTTIGDVDLNFLNQPDCKKMLDVLSSFIKALNMEQIVYESLLQVHAVGDECNDPQFCDFIESEYLEEQVTAINEIKKYIEQLKRIGDDGAGVWQFDRLFENSE
jgi:ferritin heavy chain